MKQRCRMLFHYFSDPCSLRYTWAHNATAAVQLIKSLLSQAIWIIRVGISIDVCSCVYLSFEPPWLQQHLVMRKKFVKCCIEWLKWLIMRITEWLLEILIHFSCFVYVGTMHYVMELLFCFLSQVLLIVFMLVTPYNFIDILMDMSIDD